MEPPPIVVVFLVSGKSVNKEDLSIIGGDLLQKQLDCDLPWDYSPFSDCLLDESPGLRGILSSGELLNLSSKQISCRKSFSPILEQLSQSLGQRALAHSGPSKDENDKLILFNNHL